MRSAPFIQTLPLRLLQPLVVLGAVVTALVLPVGGQTTRPTTQPVNADADGLAIEGYDPVAYFTQNKAVPGDPAITARHGGATYRFSSHEHHRAFEKNPSAYLPAFGGFCGYGLAKGMLAPTDPTVFQMIDGRLILQYDAGAATTFAKDIPGNMAKAEENWKTLSKKP